MSGRVHAASALAETPSPCSDHANARPRRAPLRDVNPQDATTDQRTGSGGSGVVWATHVTHHSRPHHCTMGMKCLQQPVNCRPLVTHLKWMADSRPNLQPETAPGQAEKNSRSAFPCFRSGSMTRRRKRARTSRSADWRIFPIRVCGFRRTGLSCWGGRPPSTGVRGRMGSSMTSNEGAVRGNCSNRFGHVKKRISATWR
jgi:hypothetical protein